MSRGIRLPVAVVAALAALTSSAFAFQVSPKFTGRVVDEKTDKPVSGAIISVAGFPGTVKTDADGQFTWEPQPTPPFQIIIVLPGGQVAKPAVRRES